MDNQQPATGAEMDAFDSMHGLRRSVDVLIKSVAFWKNNPPMITQTTQGVVTETARGVRELSLAYTKLQEAKMWLGKVLEEMGSQLPVEFRDEIVDGEGSNAA